MTAGGWLLVLAIAAPSLGVLLAIGLGGHWPERLALLAAPIGLAIAVAITAAVLWAGDAVTYVLGGWAPPLGIALRADGLAAAMLLTTATVVAAVTLFARAEEGTPRGAVFVPFCYYEAAINKLTHAALDPFAKIPEFKYCAIRVRAGGEMPRQGSYGGGQLLAPSPAAAV